jgi:cell division transport system permease protein
MVLRLMGRGVRDLWLHHWAALLTVTAVTLAAFLAGLFMLVLHNLDRELAAHAGEVEFQVYWERDADMAQVRLQWESLLDLEHLQSRAVFTPEQALQELSRALGTEEFPALEGDDVAPLPPTALLIFNVPDLDPRWPRQMLERLRAMKGVTEVSYNPLQMELARSWTALTRRVVWPLIGLLGLAAALIVGNTIKLAFMQRQDEVEILRLVGARRWYIELPLLTGGALVALAGALAGVGLLKLFQLGVRDVLAIPPLMLRVEYLPWPQLAFLAGAFALVGTAASWAAVRR